MRIPRLAAAFALPCLVALVGCGGGSSSSAPATAQGEVSVSITQAQALQTLLTPQTFKAAVSGASDGSVNWSVVSGGGTMDAATGVYTAPATLGRVVVKAQSKADPSKSATATVTLVSPPSITGFTTDSALIPYGGTAHLTPTYVTDGTAVISPSVGGSVASGGSYAVSPVAITSYTLTVTNSAGTSVASTVTVDVQTAQVSIAPAAVTLTAGATQNFNAVVGGAVNTGVTWSATGGSITTGGVYTAPATPGSYAVVARSAADASKSVLASVTVVAAPVITSFGGVNGRTSVSKGSALALVYAFTGGAGSIDQGVGPVVNNGNSNVAPASTTKYTLSVTNAAGSSASTAFTVTVVPQPDATITLGASTPVGSLLSNTGGFTASVAAQAGSTYAWSIPTAQGTITAGAGTNAVTFATKGGGQPLNLKCTVTNGAGDAASGEVDFAIQRHWLPPVSLAPMMTGINAVPAEAALDDSGNAFLLWEQSVPSTGYYGIYASRRTNGVWSAPVRMDNLTGYEYLNSLQIRCNASGQAIAAWAQFDPTVGGYVVYARRYNSGAWESLDRLDGLAAGSNLGVAQVRADLDNAGRAMVVWTQHDSSSLYRVYANNSDTSGTWGTATQIDGTGSSTTASVYSFAVALVADAPSGRALAIWMQGSPNYSPKFSVFNGSNWGSPSQLYGTGSIPASGSWSMSVAAASDRAGSVSVAAQGFDGSLPNVYVARVPLGLGYTNDAQLVASGSGSTYLVAQSISISPTGRGVLALEQIPTYGNHSIFLSTLDPSVDVWSPLSSFGNSSVNNGNCYAAIDSAGDMLTAWNSVGSSEDLDSSVFNQQYGWWSNQQVLGPGPGWVAFDHRLFMNPNGVGLDVGLYLGNGGYVIYAQDYR